MDESLKKKFQILLEYQKKDLELKKLNNMLDRDASRMSMMKYKKVFNDAKQALSDCETQAGELVEAYTELQRYIEENEAVLALLENAESVSEEDLEARIKKLDGLKSKFASADKKMRNIDEKSRSVCKTRSEAVKTGTTAKAQYADAKGKHDKLRSSKEGELKKLNEDLEAMRKELDPKLYAEYKKLVEENKFPPVVPAAGDEKKGMFNCGGCGLGLPQQGNAALHDKGWCYCDNCHRIIVKLN